MTVTGHITGFSWYTEPVRDLRPGFDITTGEAATLTGLPDRSIRRLAVSGAVDAVLFAGRWYISISDLREKIDAGKIVPGKQGRRKNSPMPTGEADHTTNNQPTEEKS